MNEQTKATTKKTTYNSKMEFKRMDVGTMWLDGHIFDYIGTAYTDAIKAYPCDMVPHRAFTKLQKAVEDFIVEVDEGIDEQSTSFQINFTFFMGALGWKLSLLVLETTDNNKVVFNQEYNSTKLTT